MEWPGFTILISAANSISIIANITIMIATTLITIALWQTGVEWEQQRSGNNRESNGRPATPQVPESFLTFDLLPHFLLDQLGATWLGWLLFIHFLILTSFHNICYLLEICVIAQYPS